MNLIKVPAIAFMIIVFIILGDMQAQTKLVSEFKSTRA